MSLKWWILPGLPRFSSFFCFHYLLLSMHTEEWKIALPVVLPGVWLPLANCGLGVSIESEHGMVNITTTTQWVMITNRKVVLQYVLLFWVLQTFLILQYTCQHEMKWMALLLCSTCLLCSAFILCSTLLATKHLASYPDSWAWVWGYQTPPPPSLLTLPSPSPIN